MNEDKPAAGGLSIGTINQNDSGNLAIQGDIVDGGSVKGDNATVTNTGVQDDPWDAVEEAIDELDDDETVAAAARAKELKTALEDPEADESVIKAAVEALAPYKPVMRAALTAASFLPGGAIAIPLIKGAIELVK